MMWSPKLSTLPIRYRYEIEYIDKLKDWAEEYIFNNGIDRDNLEFNGSDYVLVDKIIFIIRDKNRRVKDVRTFKNNEIVFLNRGYFLCTHEDIENLKIECINHYWENNGIIVHLKEKSRACQKLEREEKDHLLSDIKEKENKDLYNQ